MMKLEKAKTVLVRLGFGRSMRLHCLSLCHMCSWLSPMVYSTSNSQRNHWPKQVSGNLFTRYWPIRPLAIMHYYCILLMSPRVAKRRGDTPNLCHEVCMICERVACCLSSTQPLPPLRTESMHHISCPTTPSFPIVSNFNFFESQNI